MSPKFPWWPFRLFLSISKLVWVFWNLSIKPVWAFRLSLRICQAFKGCHHPGGSFIYWAHVTSLTCKVTVPSINTSHSWIDIGFTNHKRYIGYILTEIPQWRVLADTEFKLCKPCRVFKKAFDSLQHLGLPKKPGLFKLRPYLGRAFEPEPGLALSLIGLSLT